MYISSAKLHQTHTHTKTHTHRHNIEICVHVSIFPDRAAFEAGGRFKQLNSILSVMEIEITKIANN